MSRSRKKTPIFGMTKAQSEKEDKRLANRRLRRAIANLDLTEVEVVPVIREVSDPWLMAKDGKGYRPDLDKKYLRK
jgi:hypothetical protein